MKSNAAKPLLTLLFFIILISCTSSGVEIKQNELKNASEFSYSTENMKRSGESIDNGITWEIFFMPETALECIGVELDTVYLRKKFPVQTIPQKSYFIVEKILAVPGKKSGKKVYIPLGRNFTDNWELHSPVRICGRRDDPVSSIDRSVYRLRFTTFDTLPVSFTVTVYSDSAVKFALKEAELEKPGQ